MKKQSKKASNLKYIIALILIAFVTINTFIDGVKQNEKYRNYINGRNSAVSVVATVQSSYLGFWDEVEWNAGAGDDVDKEVITHQYRIHLLTYEYKGKEYTCNYGNSFSDIEMPKGTEVEILIDPANPENVFDEHYTPRKSSFFVTWLCLAVFLLVLVLWGVKSFKRRQKH